MTYMLRALLLASLSVAEAQRIGTAIPEVHPKLSTQKCTRDGGCVTQATSVVADALSPSRPFHVLQPQPPGLGPVPHGPEPLPDAAACATACEFEGVDYAGMGVTTDGSALTMRLFMPNKTGGYERVAPRLYLAAEEDVNYEAVRLLGQELTFDVDMSLLGCGLNAALYLDEMDFSGSRSETNPAGAQYGTGYCDAQCYNKTFVNGVPNLNNSGACCHEMDIWEANSLATAIAPHPCSKPGPFICTGDECGGTGAGVCDKSGCSLNPYKTVGHDFYGPGMAVDTKRPFTVVTQFWTQNSNNSSSAAGGNLSEIRRLYIQDGQTITTSGSPEKAGGGSRDNNTVTPKFCASSGKDSAFERLDGLEAAGAALGRGMVLIFSIWNDVTGFMNWLDAGEAGPCGPTDGAPDKILAANPDVAVTFSNIRWGDIGSTTTTRRVEV
ncbi:endo-beta-1 [Apiospora phragmitis]|uniref:Glucanase n=1 Tax=Apiospora phragmitis TaxID=2905665 RepID=A0ABR1VS67_9PEZI